MAFKRFVWDMVNDCLLAETDENGATTVVYTNEPVPYGRLISQHRGGVTSYYHFDATGSTRMLTNDAQETTDTYVYTAFGELVASTGNTENPFRYVGEFGYYYDGEALGYYVRERRYEPRIVRWLSVDPLTFELSSSGLASIVDWHYWIDPIERHARVGDPSNPQALATFGERAPFNQISSHQPYGYTKNQPTECLDPSGLMQWGKARSTGRRWDPWEFYPALAGRFPGVNYRVPTDRGNEVSVYSPDDGATYFCHGYTFDGLGKAGGPFSIYSDYVEQVLREDSWIHVCCGMAYDGIAVFWKEGVFHSGKVQDIHVTNAQFDEQASMLRSKWGPAPPLTTDSFLKNVLEHGQYRCYVKQRKVGCCPLPGDNELTS